MKSLRALLLVAGLGCASEDKIVPPDGNGTVEKRLVALGPFKVYYQRSALMGPCPMCRPKHN